MKVQPTTPMSQMNTVPVFKCRVCGKPLAVTMLRTTKPDTDGQMMNQLMANLHKIAICNDCRLRMEYLQKNNRGNEFYMSDEIVLLSNKRVDDET